MKITNAVKESRLYEAHHKNLKQRDHHHVTLVTLSLKQVVMLTRSDLLLPMVRFSPLADRIPPSVPNSLQEEFPLKLTYHPQLCLLTERREAQNRLQQPSTLPYVLHAPCLAGALTHYAEVHNLEPESHKH